MAEITASVTLTASQDWSVLPMLPIRYKVDGSENAIVITMPDPTEITGGQTQLSFEVTDVTEKVNFAGPDGVTFNGSSTLDLEVVGTYIVTIGSDTNWLVTYPYVPTA